MFQPLAWCYESVLIRHWWCFMITGAQEQRRWAAGLCNQKQNNHLRWEMNGKWMEVKF